MNDPALQRPPSARRALAILGSSSMVTIVAGILSAKVAALLLGPAGVGFVAVVQGAVGVVAAVIELGLGVAVVRAFGAGEGLLQRLEALARFARRSVWWAAGVAVAVSAAASPWLTRPVLGAHRHGYELVLCAAAAIPVALLVIENSVLIAAHRLGAIARVAVMTAFVSPAVNSVFFATVGERGVAPGTFVSAVVVLVIARLIRRRALGSASADRDTDRVDGEHRSHRAVLRDGLPVMASAVVGAMALLSLPLLVRDELGEAGVGFYRAANTISLGYTAALMTVIGADFLPRVSRVAGDPREVRSAVAAQVELLVKVMTPVLLAVGAVLPLLVEVLYRSDFRATVDILAWQLVGDVFRVVGSVLATAVFARFGGRRRFASEMIGLVLLVGMSTFGMHVDGRRGLGWGFVVTYAIYLAVLLVMLGFSVHERETRRLLVVVIGGAALSAVPPFAAAVTGREAGRLVGLGIAAVWLVGAALHWRSHRRPAAT